MKKLLVIYDKEHANKGTYSYIKAIEKQVEDYKLISIEELDEAKITETTRILVLKPMSEEHEKLVKELYNNKPELDIEGQWTSKFTTTAAAILEMVKEKFGNERVKVVIINQSETLGKPLAKKMLDLGYGVISFNTLSTANEIQGTLKHYKPDIVITATGNEKFKIDIKKSIPVIDLSEDVLKEEKVVRHIPTARILKTRLEKNQE